MFLLCIYFFSATRESDIKQRQADLVVAAHQCGAIPLTIDMFILIKHILSRINTVELNTTGDRHRFQLEY